MTKKKIPHEGSSFDDFLREDGIYEEVTAKATKRVIAWKISKEMTKRNETLLDSLITDIKELEHERHQALLETGKKATAAIEDFLNGQRQEKVLQ